MIREMELLFQASRTSPMLHEAAVTVEAGIAALRSERDELVLQNERLGGDLVAAERALADTREALEQIAAQTPFQIRDPLPEVIARSALAGLSAGPEGEPAPSPQDCGIRAVAEAAEKYGLPERPSGKRSAE